METEAPNRIKKPTQTKPTQNQTLNVLGLLLPSAYLQEKTRKIV